MIALLTRDDYSAFGLAAILGSEKIPYRRVGSLSECAAAPLVITVGDLTPADVSALGQRPAVVLGGGAIAARQLCGATQTEVRTRAATIALREPIWPVPTRTLAQTHGTSALCVPLAPVWETAGVPPATVVATLDTAGSDNASRLPAIVHTGALVWSAIDLGAAFANLLTENYLPANKHHVSSSAARAWTRRAAETVYYAAPAALRRWVQTRSYALLERQLERSPVPVSDYPNDATGWLLIELVKALIKRAIGTIVRLDHWPAPYHAAATLTHDIEPRRYAYTTGLARLLRHADVRDDTSALGLVAAASHQYLTRDRVAALNGHEVLCHGAEHRGESVFGREQVAATVHSARTQLERQLARSIRGYRSPRLDRSADLLWALDRSGFTFDSSYPDVDRENVKHFGGGVRVNLPYRPLISDGHALRSSRCLELPLTAPDCIQPLLAGQEPEVLRATVAAKAAFVRETGGLYVALVHAGVFGRHDADVREEHLSFVASQLRHPDVWFAGIGTIADWWCAREALIVTVGDGAVRVRNESPTTIAGARVVVERRSDETSFLLPVLGPEAEAVIPL